MEELRRRYPGLASTVIRALVRRFLTEGKVDLDIAVEIE
jgi:hypothetical protein